MAPELVDRLAAAATLSEGWRGVPRSVAIGAAAAVSLLAAPHFGWLGLIDRVAPITIDGAALWFILVASIVVAVVGVRLAVRLSPADRLAARIGYLIGAIGLLSMVAVDASPIWRDSRAYFDHSLPDPYGVAYQLGGIAYPPPFPQVLAPLVALGWPAFAVIWTGAVLFVVERMLGPTSIAILLVPLVAIDVVNGNVNLFIAAALVYGFRWPGLLAIAILPKVTPAVGLLWFLTRREWRSLASAMLATGSIALASIVIAPDLWQSWITTATTSTIPPGALDVGPLLPRLAIAGALIVWAAAHDRPWIVPIGVLIAMPVIWPATVSILIACVPLSRPGPAATPRRRAVDPARSRAIP